MPRVTRCLILYTVLRTGDLAIPTMIMYAGEATPSVGLVRTVLMAEFDSHGVTFSTPARMASLMVTPLRLGAAGTSSTILRDAATSPRHGMALALTSAS